LRKVLCAVLRCRPPCHDRNVVGLLHSVFVPLPVTATVKEHVASPLFVFRSSGSLVRFPTSDTEFIITPPYLSYIPVLRGFGFTLTLTHDAGQKRKAASSKSFKASTQLIAMLIGSLLIIHLLF